MEITFAIAALILGLLYIGMILVAWDLRTPEFYLFRLAMLFVIVIFSLLAGNFLSAGIWIFNMLINAYLWGNASK